MTAAAARPRSRPRGAPRPRSAHPAGAGPTPANPPAIRSASLSSHSRRRPSVALVGQSSLVRPRAEGRPPRGTAEAFAGPVSSGHAQGTLLHDRDFGGAHERPSLDLAQAAELDIPGASG